MRTYIAALIAAVATIVGVLLAWYLTQSEPVLRYQLSSPILITGTGGGIRNVQQLEIVNVGKAAAQPVQIRFRKQVSRPTVIKDSEADNYRQFDTAAGSELVYDSLRPSGHLKVVITGGDAMTEQDIEIRDQQGSAKGALAPQESWWKALASWWVLMMFGLYGWLSARAYRKWQIEFKARHSPQEIFRIKRPMLISEDVWGSCREQAARQLREGNYSEPADATAWEVYRLLNSPRPRRVPEDDWAKYVPQIKDALLARMEAAAAKANSSSDPGTLCKLLSTVRPIAVLDEHWRPMLKRIGDLYVSAAVAEATKSWRSAKDLLKVLAQAKPDTLDENAWAEYQGKVRSLYCARLVGSLQVEPRPASFISSADLTPLEEGVANNLKRFAYRMEMSGLPDVSTSHGASKFLTAPKPDFMSDKDYHEWAGIAGRVRDLTSREVQFHERLASLVTQESQTATLKSRVLRQLEIIEKFTADPATVDGIEDYEGAFAPRNLANLRRLAALRENSADK